MPEVSTVRDAAAHNDKPSNRLSNSLFGPWFVVSSSHTVLLFVEEKSQQTAQNHHGERHKNLHKPKPTAPEGLHVLDRLQLLVLHRHGTFDPSEC